MCAVSMVTQTYMDQVPILKDWSLPLFNDFEELVRKARLYDEMTNQPDCPDPKKDEWRKSLEDFIREKYGIESK
jgi:hypothetical protein